MNLDFIFNQKPGKLFVIVKEIIKKFIISNYIIIHNN